MRDEIGNKIEKGRLLYLKHWNCTAFVLEVAEGGLSKSPRPDDITPPILSLRIDMPIDTKDLPRGKEVQLQGMLCVVNPKEEAVLDDLMSGKKN